MGCTGGLRKRPHKNDGRCREADGKDGDGGMADSHEPIKGLVKDYYKLPYESFCDICEADNCRCFEFEGEDYIILNRWNTGWFIATLRQYWAKKLEPKPLFGPCETMEELFALPCLGGKSFAELYDELAIFDDTYTE